MFDFKSLVSSLLSKNTPASSAIQSATLLVRDLPQAEYFTALVEIIKAITKINQDTTISLKERVKTLLYVDDKAHTIHEQLCNEFLSGKPGSKTLLPTILAYWHEMVGAYLICLKSFQSNPGSQADPEFSKAIQRGLHHQTRLIAWNALRYLKPEGAAWLQSYYFYNFAEELGLARQYQPLYEDSKTELSCEQLLLQGCMLFLAQTDNMLGKEIIAVDQLLMELCKGVRLEKTAPNDTLVYAMNLATADNPQLMLRGMMGKSFRFWSVSEITSNLADIMFDLDKTIPYPLNSFQSRLDRQEWLALCEKLAIRWSNDGGKSLRKSERALHNADAYITIGFEQVAFNIKTQDTDVEGSSHWKINDISQSGLGLTYAGKPAEGLSIGKLILVKTTQHPMYLGVIRRIQRQQANTKVGIEILGQNPVGVSLQDAIDSQSLPATAIYITQPNSRRAHRWFIIPSAIATPNKELILTAQGKSYKISLKDPQVSFSECTHSDFDTHAKVE